jgi:hypothetical protein
LGLHLALQSVGDMRLNNIDFEVDFKTTKEAVYLNRVDISELGHIITASRNLLSSNFVNPQVEFVRRQENAVAHTFAGETTFLDSPGIYFHIPQCIETLIVNEML